MNLQTIKQTVSRSYGRGSLVLQKYSPEILLGLGLVGGVVAVILAVKAAKEDNIEQHHIENMEIANHIVAENNLSKEEEMKVKTGVYLSTGLEFAKLYGPALGVGVLSVSAILGSHGVMAKRQVALVGAYNLLAEGFKTYRKRVVEELGEEVDHNYLLGLKDETYTEKETDEEGNVTKVKKTKKVADKFGTASIYSRFFDESNPQYRSDRLLNKAFLLSQQNYMNDILTIRGHVFLNEVYEALGFPHTKEGSIVGWVLKDPKTMKEDGRDGFVDFGIYDIYNDPGREFVNLTNPTILLDFNVDGIIYNLI